MSDLQSFVREALAAGISRAEIQSALREAGWREDEIAQELLRFAEVAFPLPVPRPRNSRWRLGDQRSTIVYRRPGTASGTHNTT